jgi:hypothetical protein
MCNTIFGPGAVGAGAALRYGSGSDQMMRLHNIDYNICLHFFYPFF